MIVGKTLQVILGLIFIGSFNCGNGYFFPSIKIIQFPNLNPAFKVQRIAEISNKVLHDPGIALDLGKAALEIIWKMETIRDIIKRW